MDDVLGLLSGGDRRSIGRVPEVVALLEQQPALFPTLIDAMEHSDPVVRMRAADAVEKITARHPDYLHPYTQRLIHRIAPMQQQEIRWHVAQMVPRLQMSAEERAEIARVLFAYLDDRSAIVQTCALQALAEIAQQDRALQSRVVGALESAIATGSAAVRSRGRKLLAELKRE